jgi:hypothetical protein
MQTLAQQHLHEIQTTWVSSIKRDEYRHVCTRADVGGKARHFHTPFSWSTATDDVVVVMSGGERLRSHSIMKSAAVRLMLLGVRRFSTGGRSSSSLLGELGVDGEMTESRDLEVFFLLMVG